MTQACEEILTFLGCDYELFEESAADQAVRSAYRGALAAGEGEGWRPLLVVPSDTLAEMLELFVQEGDVHSASHIVHRREMLIRQAAALDAEDFLRARLAEYSQMHEGCDLLGAFLPAVRVQDRLGLPRDKGGEVILAKIPAAQAWELPLWVPMGGFNDCPGPTQQAAVFRSWQARFGASPALVSDNSWELIVRRPALSDADCEALAKEHFAFSYGRVMRSQTGSIRGLASALRGATIWTFWWD